MFERFSAEAKSSVVRAVTEARERGDQRVNTEHLLLAVLHESDVAPLLGVRPDAARTASAELDRAALAAVGVDIGGFAPTGTPPKRKSPPFSSGAKQALSRSLAFAIGGRSRRIEPRHLVLALLERGRPDPVADLFAALDVDVPAAQARLIAG